MQARHRKGYNALCLAITIQSGPRCRAVTFNFQHKFVEGQGLFFLQKIVKKLDIFH
jgi:hypothetical protein